MEERRITIKDIAEELGLSTATVSNVIHGKTKKISERTISKVQEKLQESGYIPNMAAVLLAQNSSKIICVVLSDDIKYDGKMIEDPFVSSVLNGLSKEIAQKGYFMMVKEEKNLSNIVKYASMWNVAGLILMGYCEIDYDNLRSQMHIPFVVVDSYKKEVHHYSDVGLDNIRGGELAGEYLIQNGHSKIMYIADNKEGCDYDRYVGLKKSLNQHGFEIMLNDFKLISMNEKTRIENYNMIFREIERYTAVFSASDVYAIEFMNFLIDKGLSIPDEFSVMGFDNIPLSNCVRPRLTTISQDMKQRAKVAVELLEELINEGIAKTVLLPVSLEIRESIKNIR